MWRIITTIAPVHLEFFGTLTKIADAKAEIFLGTVARRRRGQCRRDNAQLCILIARAQARRTWPCDLASASTPDRCGRPIKCAPVGRLRRREDRGRDSGPAMHFQIGASGAISCTTALARVGGRRAGRRMSCAAALACYRFSAGVTGRGTRFEVCRCAGGTGSNSSTRAIMPIPRRCAAALSPSWFGHRSARAAGG